MAEQTPAPSLPSTADATPYVPVSWVAALAAVVAGAFVVTLVFFGLIAFRERKPLLEPGFLIFPIVALVLCFAARRTIQNSEGTRTGILYGIDLVNTAWWLSLILGLCYVAYLFAIDFAIQRDARGEAEKWMGYVAAGEEDNLARAFHRTMHPGARANLAADDAAGMRGRFRDEFLTFENCDLLKIARRNKGELSFKFGSLTSANRPGGLIDCSLAGTVKCPEGSFPVVIPLKGFEAVAVSEGGGGGGRQWMVERPRGGGFIDQAGAKRTPYGWLLLILEESGGNFGKAFVDVVKFDPIAHPYAFRGFIAPGGDLRGWSIVATDPRGVTQLAFAVPAAIAAPGYTEYMASHFFKLPGGAEPPGDQKAQFFAAWNSQGLRQAGERLKGPDGGPIDKENLITVTDRAVEVRVPVEIPIPGKLEVARGRVVVECTDPNLLAEIRQFKASANPDQGTAEPPEEWRRRPFNWRVVRVESNMVPLSPAQPQQQMPRG